MHQPSGLIRQISKHWADVLWGWRSTGCCCWCLNCFPALLLHWRIWEQLRDSNSHHLRLSFLAGRRHRRCRTRHWPAPAHSDVVDLDLFTSGLTVAPVDAHGFYCVQVGLSDAGSVCSFVFCFAGPCWNPVLKESLVIHGCSEVFALKMLMLCISDFVVTAVV